MKRVLSGIKPTGDVTLGNYLGMMQRIVAIQNQGQTEQFYFIANLHALNARPDPKDMAENTLKTAAWLLAAGVDWRKSLIYVQSQIPAHSELAWILNNYVTMGELSRMTQFKDKSQKVGAEGQLVGLYDYPVLMAADILLYDADEVPVGDDQKQHVELTRDIAERFNQLYGPTFKVPQPSIANVGARIMNLQDPSRKMDKSDQDQSGVIMMSDSMKVVEAKVMRAVTDSGSHILAGADKPALTNLLSIFALLEAKTVSDIEYRYRESGYSEFKRDLSALVAERVRSLQEKQLDVLDERDRLLSVLQEGRDRAIEIAEAKLGVVKAKLGLL